MECLDRGVIAVPSGNGLFVSWRLFGTDPANVSFRLYRQNGGGAPALVCTKGPMQGTCCLDANPGGGAAYSVRAVIDGVEGSGSAPVTALDTDYVRIPLRAASSGAFVHLAWVGDLDGDGGYDVVVDRISADAPLVDAYSRSGQFLWRMNTGPLGANQDNIEGGAATISNGHWDGLTVFDFDGNGSAEVAIKTANGFTFGDGTTLRHGNDQDQFVSIVNGRTGAEIARAPLPDDYESDGPLQCHFGVGYFDGVRPSVVTKCKNRIGSGVIHGDRFHVTDMDPARPGLEGWGIQQDNPNGLETYYYDARTGQILRTYTSPSGTGADMGRGTIADLFPERPGYEYWSFNGMFSAGSGALVVAEENENVPCRTS